MESVRDFCRKQCTNKLGWSDRTRQQCRHATPCECCSGFLENRKVYGQRRLSKVVKVRRVQPCARCGGTHSDLKFVRLGQPHFNWTHWTSCPSTGEPILLITVKLKSPKILGA